MSRGKWAGLVLVLAAAAFACWYFYSPTYTLQEMKAAAQGNDSDAFSSYIDYPALRENMKAELMAQLIRESRKDKSGFGGLGIAIGSAMIGPIVDGMVSPAGIRAAFIANRAKPSGKVGKAAMKPFELQDKPVIVRRSFSEFAVTSQKPDQGAMVFTRHGLGWKLSGIDLPSTRLADNREDVLPAISHHMLGMAVDQNRHIALLLVRALGATDAGLELLGLRISAAIVRPHRS